MSDMTTVGTKPGSKLKIAVFGASGFAGSVIVKHLLKRDDIETLAIIRSSATAWELSRYAIPMRSVDILQPDQIKEALTGVTHVVNCTRGDNQTMFQGLKNLLTVSKECGVTRFVHLSSVAVYGDPPSPDSVNEDGATVPGKNTYGWIKLKQDKMVEQAHAKGLSSIIVCPPNITGPDSPFLLQVIDAMKNNRLALIDGGDTVCNVVDVANLAHAVECALEADAADGKRYFVTDAEDVSWKNITDSLRECSTDCPPPAAVERQRLISMVDAENAAESEKGSIISSMKHLVSGDVRGALRQDPLIARVDVFLRSLVDFLPPRMLGKLRFWIAGPSIEIPRPRSGNNLHVRLTGQQLRDIRHSAERARQKLHYEPSVTYQDSMKAFRKAYRSMHETDGENSALLKLLG